MWQRLQWLIYLHRRLTFLYLLRCKGEWWEEAYRAPFTVTVMYAVAPRGAARVRPAGSDGVPVGRAESWLCQPSVARLARRQDLEQLEHDLSTLKQLVL